MRLRTRALLLRFAVVIAALSAFLPQARAVDVNSLPKPTGYVSDLANVVDPADKASLEAFCERVEGELGVQFALVTIDSVGDQPIRDFALDLGRKWGVGDRKSNQGVLLLLAVKDRKSDIDTGRGIEPYIPDGFAGGTLRAIRPYLRGGNYGAALVQAAHTMAQQIAQGKGIGFADTAALPPPREELEPPARVVHHGIPFPLIVVGILFLLWILRRGGGGRGRPYGGGGGAGFWTGLLLGNLLGGGRGGGWGGGWGDGGGFGGGSGGGGGFGGFGGGDFGGGGASSDW